MVMIIATAKTELTAIFAHDCLQLMYTRMTLFLSMTSRNQGRHKTPFKASGHV